MFGNLNWMNICMSKVCHFVDFLPHIHIQNGTHLFLGHLVNVTTPNADNTFVVVFFPFFLNWEYRLSERFIEVRPHFLAIVQQMIMGRNTRRASEREQWDWAIQLAQITCLRGQTFLMLAEVIKILCALYTNTKMEKIRVWGLNFQKVPSKYCKS